MTSVLRPEANQIEECDGRRDYAVQQELSLCVKPSHRRHLQRWVLLEQLEIGTVALPHNSDG